MTAHQLRIIGVADALLGIAAIMTWLHGRSLRLANENEALRRRLDQAASPTGQPQRVDNSTPRESIPPKPDVHELMQLRARATRMREIGREDARLGSERDRVVRPTAPAVPSETVADADTPEWAVAQGAMVFSKGLGLAVLVYADQHYGRMSPDLLAALEALGMGQFEAFISGHMPDDSSFDSIRDIDVEMAFRGHLDDISGRDPRTVIVARQAEPIALANGRWARACVFGDGSSRVLVADTLDELTATEMEFLLPQDSP